MSDFKFEFKKEQCLDIMKGNKKATQWYDAFCKVLPKYSIDTEKRVAAFLAQCGHESNNFTVLSENLNYSAKGLLGTFKKYFPSEAEAKAYERQPEKIANKIYASRMGNGDQASGDGFKFRGRGPIQLTGRSNYETFAFDMFPDDPHRIIDNPDLVSTDFEIALMSAVWFWNRTKLNALADKGDIKMMTKRINGGFIGLEDRIKHYEHALHVLGA